MLFLPRFHCDTQSIKILPYLVATPAWEPHVNKRNDVLRHPNNRSCLRQSDIFRAIQNYCDAPDAAGGSRLSMLGVPEDVILATRRSILLNTASQALPATRLCHDARRPRRCCPGDPTFDLAKCGVPGATGDPIMSRCSASQKMLSWRPDVRPC